ncbi:MAG: serine--tRNA ligase [bacterium]
MLDIKRIRSDFDNVQSLLNKRGKDFDLSIFLELDEKRRGLLVEVEELKNKQNVTSKQIPTLKKEGKDTTQVMADMKELSERIKNLDVEVREVDAEIQENLYAIPNTPNEIVPDGSDENDNIEIRKWGEPKKFEFEPKPHWDLGEALDILDFSRGAKITGARFTIYKGLGARLERALINFMLDTHTEKHGYTEVLPPQIANKDSLRGTGQLPKFEEDMFKLVDTEYFLVPTAEVPVTNMYRDEILDGSSLNIKHCAYTACFRAEAGAAGRDSRGLIRQHQFNKVELVKFTKPEDSYKELEELTNDAENILKLLNLPYRLVRLCGGDLGFSSAMTYDIEVWLPSYNKYVEISSCSNFEDYQARRANIKFKDHVKDKAKLVHTLNGSGLAIGRTVSAILENFQQEDGSILIPDVLVPYMGNKKEIKPNQLVKQIN